MSEYGRESKKLRHFIPANSSLFTEIGTPIKHKKSYLNAVFYYYACDSTSESDCDIIGNEVTNLVRYNNYLQSVFKRNSYREWVPIDGVYKDKKVLSYHKRFSYECRECNNPRCDGVDCDSEIVNFDDIQNLKIKPEKSVSGNFSNKFVELNLNRSERKLIQIKQFNFKLNPKNENSLDSDCSLENEKLSIEKYLFSYKHKRSSISGSSVDNISSKNLIQSPKKCTSSNSDSTEVNSTSSVEIDLSKRFTVERDSVLEDEESCNVSELSIDNNRYSAEIDILSVDKEKPIKDSLVDNISPKKSRKSSGSVSSIESNKFLSAEEEVSIQNSPINRIPSENLEKSKRANKKILNKSNRSCDDSESSVTSDRCSFRGFEWIVDSLKSPVRRYSSSSEEGSSNENKPVDNISPKKYRKNKNSPNKTLDGSDPSTETIVERLQSPVRRYSSSSEEGSSNENKPVDNISPKKYRKNKNSPNKTLDDSDPSTETIVERLQYPVRRYSSSSEEGSSNKNKPADNIYPKKYRKNKNSIKSLYGSDASTEMQTNLVSRAGKDIKNNTVINKNRKDNALTSSEEHLTDLEQIINSFNISRSPSRIDSVEADNISDVENNINLLKMSLKRNLKRKLSSGEDNDGSSMDETLSKKTRISDISKTKKARKLIDSFIKDSSQNDPSRNISSNDSSTDYEDNSEKTVLTNKNNVEKPSPVKDQKSPKKCVHFATENGKSKSEGQNEVSDVEDFSTLGTQEIDFGDGNKGKSPSSKEDQHNKNHTNVYSDSNTNDNTSVLRTPRFMSQVKSQASSTPMNKIQNMLANGVTAEHFEEDLFFAEDLSENDEIWMAQCPKSLKLDTLVGTELNFGGTTLIDNGKNDRPTSFEARSNLYSDTVDDSESLMNDTVTQVYCLFPSREHHDTKLKCIKAVGEIKFEEKIISPTPYKIKLNSSMEITFNENLKIRHPLLGTDDSANKKSPKHLRVLGTKRKSSSTINSIDENDSLSCQIVNSLDQKKKKKKKKKSKNKDDEEFKEDNVGDNLDYSDDKKSPKHLMVMGTKRKYCSITKSIDENDSLSCQIDNNLDRIKKKKKKKKSKYKDDNEELKDYEELRD